MAKTIVTKGKETKDNRYLQLVKKFPLRPIESEENNDIAGELCADMALRYDKLSPGEKDYLAVLTMLVDNFESQWREEDDVEPRELLAFLMDQNGLVQKDLIPIFGTSSRISEFISGKRDLSIGQVMGLAKRFNLSPTAFLPKIEK